MELIKIVAEIVIDWIRETLVNVGGRVAEEFIGTQIKRGKRRSNRQRKAGGPRSINKRSRGSPERARFSTSAQADRLAHTAVP